MLQYTDDVTSAHHLQFSLSTSQPHGPVDDQDKVKRSGPQAMKHPRHQGDERSVKNEEGMARVSRNAR